MRHVRAIVILPGTVTLIVPAVVLWWTDSWAPLRYPSLQLSMVALVAGLSLVVVGFVLWFKTVVLFSRAGKGTLAPWDPPEHLVVRGIYRHVRNPMIGGVCLFLAGETVLFASYWFCAWLIVFSAVNFVYIRLVEEPALARRFGEDYELYRRNVPRCIPKLTPWEPPE